MTCFGICKKSTPAAAPRDAHRDERQVVEKDAAFQKAAKDFAHDMARFGQYGDSAKATAEAARDVLAARVLELTDSAPSGDVAKNRLGAIKQVILKEFKAKGAADNEEDLYSSVFEIFQDFAVYKAVKSFRSASGDIEPLYTREAQHLVAYGFYTDEAAAYKDIRNIHRGE